MRALILLAVALALPATAWAQPDPFVSRLSVGIVPYLGLMGAGDGVTEGDVVSTRPGLGILAEASMRLHPHFSLGLLAGGQGWGHVVEVHRTTLWRMALEGRWHMRAPPGKDVWLAVDAGGIAVHDRTEDAQLPSGTELSPALGAAAGIDWRLGRQASLGVELRGFVSRARMPARVDIWAVDHTPRSYELTILPVTLGFALRWGM